MGDEPVRDVHGKIVGRIAGPALRHEEQIPGPIVGGDSVRGGRRRQTKSQRSNVQSKLPHRHSPFEWTRYPQSHLVTKGLRAISAVASVSIHAAREPGQQGYAPNFILANPLIHTNQRQLGMRGSTKLRFLARNQRRVQGLKALEHVHPALLFLMSQFWRGPSISEVIRQRTLCECAWSLLSGVRFRTNLSFAPDRLACESRRFWDRSRKPG